LPLIGAAVPLAVGTGTESRIVGALMFSMFLLIAWVVRGAVYKDMPLVASPIVVPTLLLILIWIIAYLCSIAIRDPLVVPWSTFPLAQVGGLAVAVIPSGILLLALNVGCDVRWIRLGVWSFLAVGLVAVLTYFGGLAQLSSSVLETGGMFTMWTVALGLSQALFNERLSMKLRVGLGVFAVVWLLKALILQTWWFSGWLPSLVVAVVLIFMRSRPAFVATMVMAGLVIAARWQTVYDAVWGVTVKKGDLTRLDIWQQSLDLWHRYPLLGTGPAGYAVYFQNFYVSSRFSLSTHNNYMDVLAETGVAGAVIFALFLLTFVCVGWQARDRWRSGFEGAYAQGAIAGLLGLIVAMTQGDWFIPFVYNQTIAGYRYTVHSWVFLGFLASLAALRHQPKVD
jgi:hypothetical protein